MSDQEVLKIEATHVDRKVDGNGEEELKIQHRVLKSRLDELSVWSAVRRFSFVTGIAMAAAFSASLDGYQINLNGGIVSNAGFIKQMARPGTTIIDGKYVSAWGGIQSAGQFIGQVLIQYVTEAAGRKWALYMIASVIVLSVIIESVVQNWQMWLVAKLFAGIGVGSLQATLPVYISELSPTQLRGFLINAYSFWFVVGQLLAAVALRELNALHPDNFRTAIYTQWGMVGGMLVIFAFLPESPWWLVSKGKLERAETILLKHFGRVEGYNVTEELQIMVTTVEEARQAAERNERGSSFFDVFKGTNGLRLVISLWPKLTQQFVGLTVFNTYSTYFFQVAGNKNPFTVTVILACVQLLSTLTVCFATDTWGRRPLTIYPYAITVASVLALGIVGCFDYTSPALGSLLIFFACLATFTTTGASAIGYAYLAEIPPQQVRAKMAAWGLALTNLVATMFSFVAPIMIKGSGDFKGWNVKTGFFFAGTGTIAVIISWFLLPEVTRRTAAEIDEMFEKRISPRGFRNHVTQVELDYEERKAMDEHALA